MSYPYEPNEQRAQPAWQESVRRAVVILWVSFIGGVFAMPLLLWVDHAGLQDLGNMTIAFLLAWLLAVVPASLTLLLLQRPQPQSPAPHHESGSGAP